MFFGIDKDKIIKKSILVSSADEARLKSISEQLTVRGLDVKPYNKDFTSLNPKDISKNLEAIIIDLGTIKDLESSIDFIIKILPKNIICIVFANNDSIKIRQEFLNKGLKYLHFETQLNHLYQEIENQHIQNTDSHSIKISVLGTKGGVGNSFISYQLASIIYERYKNKVLLVQGAHSSFNIDLLANRSFTGLDYRDKDICLYKETDFDAYGFEKFAAEKFNFVVYDHSVQSLDKDDIEYALNSSDCVVVVIGTQVASIRKAKEILHANEFLRSVNQGSKKLIVVLNEISNLKTLSKMDISDILRHEIDAVIPIANSKEIKSLTKGKIQKALDELASLVIGNGSSTRGFKKLFKSVL